MRWSDDLHTLYCSTRPSGRVEAVVIPSVELALIVHLSGHANAARSYGALATYVAHHGLAVDGPRREYYLTSSRDTTDESQWQTEIGSSYLSHRATRNSSHRVTRATA